jgi:hypothetical protein
MTPRRKTGDYQKDGRRTHECSSPPVPGRLWNRLTCGTPEGGLRIGQRTFCGRDSKRSLYCGVCRFDNRDIRRELVSLSSNGDDQARVFRVVLERLA